MKIKLALIFSLSLFVFYSCTGEKKKKLPEDFYREYPVREIKINGIMNSPKTEISGLAWHRDDLIILPQFPDKFSEGENGTLFAINKEIIKEYLSNEIDSITPGEIEFVSKGLERFEGYGSGFEAIAFDGDTVYVSIEYVSDAPTQAVIVKGIYDNAKNKIILQPDRQIFAQGQTGEKNWSYEAITLTSSNIIALYEANGKNVNPLPLAKIIDKNLMSEVSIPIRHLEYRITDATAVDNEGKFYILNYYWPGDEKILSPAEDSLSIQFGKGGTHRRYKTVERIVELQFDGSGVNFSGTPPIQLKLISDKNSRNWEGIARYDSAGFIIATDSYPRTILGFVDIN